MRGEARTLEGNHIQVGPSLELNLHVCPCSSGIDGPLNYTVPSFLERITGACASEPNTRQASKLIFSVQEGGTHILTRDARFGVGPD